MPLLQDCSGQLLGACQKQSAILQELIAEAKAETKTPALKQSLRRQTGGGRRWKRSGALWKFL